MPYDYKAARQAGVSDDEILKVLVERVPRYDLQGALKAGVSKEEIITALAPLAHREKSLGDQVADGARAVIKALNPFEALEGIGRAVADPVGTGKALWNAHAQVGQDAIDAFKQGQYERAVVKGAYSVLPLVGPQLAAAGEKAVQGNVGEAIGEGIGAGLNLAGPGKLANVPGVKVLPGIASKNPAVKAAVEFAQQRGIPLKAAAATDNQFVKGVQKVADTSPIGAAIAGKAEEGATRAMQRVGRELADQVHPNSAVPETAGAGVRRSLEGKVDKLDQLSDKAYETFRQVESNPQNIRQVQIGTQQIDTGVLDAQGRPVMQTVPITKDVALPVDMRPIKAELQPIFDEMTQWMEPAKRNASAGYQALKSILQGEDFIPASVAEKGLGGLKSLSRQADSAATRNTSQGLAALGVERLQEAIDTAVAQAPADAGRALQSLRNGRTLTASKYSVHDVVKQLREEPVQLFNQMVYSGDSGVELLRKVQKEAPKELPKVGRAYIEQLLTKASAEGGFQGGAGLWKQWQNLGPETKKMLFKNPVHRQDLDNFFLVAKRMSENPNPSGSAVVGTHSGLIGGLVVAEPMSGVSYALGSGAISKLMNSPRGIRLLTEGMRIPLGKKAAAAGNAAAILRLAGDDARMVESGSLSGLQPAPAF
jgi:hypothetical protein